MNKRTKANLIIGIAVLAVLPFAALGAAAIFAPQWLFDTSNGMEEASLCRNGKDIVLNGNLSLGLQTKWVDLLNATEDKNQLRLFLNSPGGNVAVAETISDHVKEFGIATVLPANAVCKSACPLIFISSDNRIADPTARLEFHRTVGRILGFEFPAPWDTRIEDAMKRFPVSSKRLADIGAWDSSDFKFQTAQVMETYDPGFAVVQDMGPMPVCK